MGKHIIVTEAQYKVLKELKKEAEKEWNYPPRKEATFSESLDLVLKEAISNGNLRERMAKYDELSQYVPEIEKTKLSQKEKERLDNLNDQIYWKEDIEKTDQETIEEYKKLAKRRIKSLNKQYENKITPANVTNEIENLKDRLETIKNY